MKLTQILTPGFDKSEWEAKGYELPKFDIAAVAKKTHDNPTWVHFGAGNIFRAFPAAILNDALNTGKYDRGVIVAESFDYEIIDKAYRPYQNLSLLVSLQSSGTIEKKVIASVTESLKADKQFTDDWARLCEIFRNPSLQMITFTITEKGYSFNDADLARGLNPQFAMGKVTALLYERFKAGALAITVQSMDNCSHNGDKVKAGVFAYAEKWVADGLVEKEFLAYVKDEKKVTFPWSMIDKITPRPHVKVQEMLAADGFEDNNFLETEKHTFTAPFVNAEEVQYLVIEDNYTNGRPPLELGGTLYTTRETVDKVETMKVTTCLNPLHTAMSIYGVMLGYTLISAEMADPDLRPFIQKIGYMEAMPVVTDPGVLNPYEFIGAVINKRLPNPFMPDAPQRISTDTSQKLPIRFGETIKKYVARGLDKSNLVLIPLTLAGYARFLKALDDDLQPFTPSSDPKLEELQAIVAPLAIGKPDQDWSPLKQLFSRADIFGVNLYEAGLGEQIEGMVKELYAGKGAVRATLHKYTQAR
ncbi:MAG: mannitol dehydrogenase family protein [Bacteroidales bacterium]|jgi:fructuronate reductase|nr:mannitol dehydrogenase family protein [Bacteroidales bacterium]